MYCTPKALHPGQWGEAPSGHQGWHPCHRHLVGLRGAGTHDLHVFGGEVLILQQVVQQTLSVADVSDQMLPVDLQQSDVGVRL